MNKQELIERIECLKNLFGNKSEYVEIDTVIRLISELEEPQEVEIPMFVAVWIEVCKEHLTSSLYLAMTPSFLKANNQSIELILWIKKKENQEKFARAWLDGYKIAEGTKYKVIIKGVSPNSCMLKYYHDTERWIMGTSIHFNDSRLYHTKEELEAGGFSEVFNSPLFEVEEVE